MGASSGIGFHTARQFARAGWMVGIAARRTEPLERIRQEYPDRVHYLNIDITQKHAEEQLGKLIKMTGGMDVYLHVAGIGKQNLNLTADTEQDTVHTNCEGFTRAINYVFHIFEKQGKGHIAAVTSIAGTKGLGAAPSYSASKRYQSIYLQALAQMAAIKRLPIRITDIKPGFVDTPLLANSGSYPMLMKPERVAATIFKGILKKRRTITIDYRYACLVFFWRLIPNSLWERLRITHK